MKKKNNVLPIVIGALVISNAVTAVAYFRVNNLYRQCSVEKEELKMDSLAMRASESVKRLQTSAADASQAVQQQTEKTLAELQQIAKDASEVIRGQSEKMAAELQLASKGLLETLNKELETFQQNMSTPVQPDASAPATNTQSQAPHS